MTAFLVTLLVLGSIAWLIGWIWLIVEAFRKGEKGWGIALIVVTFIPPLLPFVAIPFRMIKREIARRPGRVIIAATIICGLVARPLARRAAEEVAEAMTNAIAQAELAHARGTDEAGAGEKPVVIEDSNHPEPNGPAQPPWPAKDNPRRSRSNKPTGAAPPPKPEMVVATNVTTNTAAPELAPATPLPDPDLAPAEISLLKLGEPTGEAMRTLRVQIRNAARQPIREVKVQLEYLDARGSRMGEWTTVHRGTETIVSENATNAFDLHAFFVPQFAHDVRLRLLRIVFADRTEWPRHL